RLFSRARCIDDVWSGLDQILFIHKLAAMDTAEVSAKLKAFQSRLASAGVLINLAAGGATAEAEKELGRRFGFFGPPRPRNPASIDGESFFGLSELSNPSGKGEVFASPSLQVGFAAISLKAAPAGSALQAADLVLSHQLSTGALWESIRMKGGAYGAFATPNSMETTFSFATYRDPNPLRSLEAFSSIITEAAAGSAGTLDAKTLEKAVIGAYSKEIRPRTPAEKSLADFFRFLYGVGDNHRSRRLKAIVAVNEEQISAVLKRLASETGSTNPVIITGKAEAEKAAKRLGVELRELPV
ncbi:MAG: peptidase M16, partial [Treponema sp.]|nr:peptidase M16 [Treponema sp.]